MLILAVESLLPGTKRLLDLVVDAIVHNKKAQRSIDMCPELNRIKALEFRYVFLTSFPKALPGIINILERTRAYTLLGLFLGGILTAAWAISVGFFIIFLALHWRRCHEIVQV
jgi:hypothetical protein